MEVLKQLRQQQKVILGIHYWTQTGKGIHIRTLCQTYEGSVVTKQRPTEMGGRTTYWTLLPYRTPFQNGTN
jgi:hypothetical protein